MSRKGKKISLKRKGSKRGKKKTEEKTRITVSIVATKFGSPYVMYPRQQKLLARGKTNLYGAYWAFWCSCFTLYKI